MRPCAFIVATVILFGSGAAIAQEVEVYPSDPYYEQYVPSGPRVYQYRSDPVEVVPARPASCGEFRYWDGNRCVDARIGPPDVR